MLIEWRDSLSPLTRYLGSVSHEDSTIVVGHSASPYSQLRGGTMRPLLHAHTWNSSQVPSDIRQLIHLPPHHSLRCISDRCIQIFFGLNEITIKDKISLNFQVQIPHENFCGGLQAALVSF